MGIHYVQPNADDWDWFVPRYAQTALESMSAHRQKFTSLEDVQVNLEKQIESFRGPEGVENIAYVAKDDVQRLGFVWAIRSTSGFTAAAFAWIMCVYVEANARGHGIGRKLMQLAEDWAREKGLLDIVLNVSAKNEAAIRLYESMDFETESMRYIKRL